MTADVLAPSVRAADPSPDAGTRADRRGLLVVAAILVLIGLRLLVLVAALPADGTKGVPAFRGDAKRYLEIASHDGVPYRDFEVEYPPVSVALIKLVEGPDLTSTMRRLAVVAFALDMLALGAVAYGWGRKAALGYLLMTTPFLFLPFIYFRIDYLAVALAMWGLVLAMRRRETAGGFLLAASVFAKLYALVVLPVLLVEAKVKALTVAIVTGLVGAVAWFAVAGTSGFEQVLSFRGASGWQIESVVGGAIRLFTGEYPRDESGAVRAGSAPQWATIALGLLMVAVVVWIWTQAWRCNGSQLIVYGVAPLTATAVFLACSPLLSPQFMTWLVPFAAICWACGERVFAWMTGFLVVITMVLTQVYQPLNRAELSGQVVLTVRNGLLLALVVVGIVTLRARARATADA